ncbi:hypothetical protein ACIBKX_34140 [Streptomyces sp. NPDC050658]|uniref:hypothetical protein n=1 Tax=unclassified Streptomyces TaxID=2593676 RepID=UPI00341A4B09
MLSAREVGEIVALLEKMAERHPDQELSRSARRLATVLWARSSQAALLQVAQEKERKAAEDRDRAADERDLHAERRDAEAEQRDFQASELDRAADIGAQRLHDLLLAAARLYQVMPRRASGNGWGGPEAVALREQAELDRELAVTDRTQFRLALSEAQAGRRAALRDRYSAGADRRAARRDRRLAQADRKAAAAMRADGREGSE